MHKKQEKIFLTHVFHIFNQSIHGITTIELLIF